MYINPNTKLSTIMCTLRVFYYFILHYLFMYYLYIPIILIGDNNMSVHFMLYVQCNIHTYICIV